MPDKPRVPFQQIDREALAALDQAYRQYETAASILALSVRDIMANAARRRHAAMAALFEETVARAFQDGDGRVDPVPPVPPAAVARPFAREIIEARLRLADGAPVARSEINAAIIAEGMTEYAARKALQLLKRGGAVEERRDGFVLVGPAEDK